MNLGPLDLQSNALPLSYTPLIKNKFLFLLNILTCAWLITVLCACVSVCVCVCVCVCVRICVCVCMAKAMAKRKKRTVEERDKFLRSA